MSDETQILVFTILFHLILIATGYAIGRVAGYRARVREERRPRVTLYGVRRDP